MVKCLLATNEEAIYVTESVKNDRRLAEHYLLNYETELKKYELAKEEFINYKCHDQAHDKKSDAYGTCVSIFEILETFIIKFCG